MADVIVIGPWTFEFLPDSDDHGVGTVEIRHSFGNVRNLPMDCGFDALTREEWDAFVRGATL